MKALSYGRLSIGLLALLLLLGRSPLRAGGLDWEIWDLVNGSTVEELVASGVLETAPSVVKTISGRFDTFTSGNTDDHGDQYGSRLRGWLQVPVSGEYRLFLASDNASQLAFSTNHTAAQAVIVARETNSAAPLFSGDRLAQRTSPALLLEAGRSYYFEVLHKEATGSDYVRVGWQKPDGTQEIIPALYLLPYDVEVAAPAFSEQPVPQSVTEGTTASLSPTVRARQPASFQWFKGDIAVPGANLQALLLPEITQA